MLNIDLTDKTALVLGGSRGIGAGIVESLCRAGAVTVSCMIVTITHMCSSNNLSLSPATHPHRTKQVAVQRARR